MKLRRRLVALPLSLALAGCGLLRTATEAPGRIASSVIPSESKAAPDAGQMQVRLMRFGDLFSVEIGTALVEFAQRVETPEGQMQALEWRIRYTNAVWRLASGPRPFAALFDTIVLITALRATHQEHWHPKWGEADQPVIDSLLRLEQAVWGLASEFLSEAQLGQVRTVVEKWMQGPLESRLVDVARLPGFDDVASSAGSAQVSLLGEVTGLLKVDPLSGLDPAVREVEQTRQLAERMFYFLQRMPEILSARVELLALRSANSPEVRRTLDDLTRVSQAAASMAETAAGLAASFAAEREATLSQLSHEIEAQRAGLVSDLETARTPVAELLAGARATADSAQAMSATLTETLQVFSALMDQFGVGKDEPEAAPGGAGAPEPTADAAEAPPGRPFDITDYGLAAERIGGAARELGTTIATLERSLPELKRVVDEAATRGEQSVDHAFRRAYQLLAAALVGGALAVLAVRLVSRRTRT